MPQLIASVQGVEVKHVYLTKPRTTLGRHPANDIVLDNMVVSSRHCVFELHGIADVFLVDAGSTNGTYVNDHMVKARTRLHDGDVISIGQFRIRYLQASEQPSGFGETMAMAADSMFQQELQASFRVTTGSSAGLTVPMVKAVTTFGKPGVSVVSVSHRRTGYFVGQLAGETPALLNGQVLGDDPVMLSDQDELDIAGTKMVFQLGE